MEALARASVGGVVGRPYVVPVLRCLTEFFSRGFIRFAEHVAFLWASLCRETIHCQDGIYAGTLSRSGNDR